MIFCRHEPIVGQLLSNHNKTPQRSLPTHPEWKRPITSNEGIDYLMCDLNITFDPLADFWLTSLTLRPTCASTDI